MALKGTLESFGISEIFQLIAHQQKTGSLEIQTPDGTARLRFLHGRLVEAWADKRTPGEMIGTLMIRAGLITQVQLEHALNMQRQSMRRIGDILTRIGAVRVAEFKEVLSLQHRETVYRLLKLQRGRFEFISEAVEVEDGVSVPMDLDELLMEGFRQIDEWPNLQAKISSDKKVFARVATTDLPKDLKVVEHRVLVLVDGASTVREVIDRARLGEFNGWDALVGLLERGLIEQVSAVRRPLGHPKGLKTGWLADALVALVFLAAAAGLVGLIFDVGFQFPGDVARGLEGARTEAAQVSERARQWRERLPREWPDLTPRR